MKYTTTWAEHMLAGVGTSLREHHGLHLGSPAPKEVAPQHQRDTKQRKIATQAAHISRALATMPDIRAMISSDTNSHLQVCVYTVQHGHQKGR